MGKHGWNRLLRLEKRVEALEEKDERITHLELAVLGHQEALTEKDERITQLEVAVSGHQEALAEKDERITQLEMMVSGHQGALTEKDERITQLEVAVSGHQEALTEKDERITQLEMMVSGHQGAPTEKDQRITQLEMKLNTVIIDCCAIPDTGHNEYQHMDARLPSNISEIPPKNLSDNSRSVTPEHSGMEVSSRVDIQISRQEDSKSISKKVDVTSGGVAFSMSLSASTTYHVNEVIVYDEVILGSATGYSTTDGIYTVPKTGVYVFAWLTTSGTHTNIQTSLMINGSKKGGTSSFAGHIGDYQSSTGVIVTLVNKGDHVYVNNALDGFIVSNQYTKPIFSGWRLF